jgi:hypothetical protein
MWAVARQGDNCLASECAIHLFLLAVSKLGLFRKKGATDEGCAPVLG